MGYNREMAYEFILDASKWVSAFDIAARPFREYLLSEEDARGRRKHISAFRISLANGRRITALSSHPKNIRSKRGHIKIDEGRYHENLAALRKAAVALTIHGGRVSFASTHDGEDSEFNQLCEEARSGEKAYSLHTTTFDEAVAQGLVRKIFQKLGIIWTQEREDEYVKKIYDWYGLDADEELRCIPRSSSGGYIDIQWLDDASYDTVPEHGAIYMSGDFAVTGFKDDQPIDGKKQSRPDCTEIAVWAVPPNREIYAIDWWHGRETSDVWIDKMIEFAEIYKPRCFFGERGPIKNAIDPHLKARMRETNTHFRCEWLPTSGGDKAARGRPMQGMAHSGVLHFPRTPWGRRVVQQIAAFKEGKRNQADDAFDTTAIMCSAVNQAHPGIEPTNHGVQPTRGRSGYGRGRRSNKNTHWWKSS